MRLLLSAMLLAHAASHAATRFSTSTGGNWNSTSTWTGGIVPVSTDNAVIRAGASVTVTASATVNSVLFTNNSASTATLTVNPGMTLTVTAGVTNRNAATTNTSALIQGGGTLTCAALTVGGTTTPTAANSALTATLISTISNLSVSGTLSVKALYNSTPNAANQGALLLGSGIVSVGGTVSFVTVPLFGPTLTLATGNQNGTLTLSGATPFTITGGGSSTFTPNGSNATVQYSGAAQTVKPAIYQNLVLSGSGTKTNSGVTVNGTLSMRGTATVSAAPTYGSGATLEYNGSAAQSSALELPAGIPNLVINNANGVTLNGSSTVSNLLSLVAGRLATGANQINLATAASIDGGDAASYIHGTLQKAFNTGAQSFTFPIGNATSFAPLAISNLTVTTAGSLRASTTSGTHPQSATNGLDPSRDVNRYWTLVQSGGTFGAYHATFNYPAANVDADAVPEEFVVFRYSGGAWTEATVGGIPTTNATTIINQNGFGDFAVGNAAVPAQMVSGTYIGDGTDGRAIANLPFVPDVVVIKGALTRVAVIRTATMTGDSSKEMTGATALQSNCIQALGTNGFVIGSSTRVNDDDITYCWHAFKAGAGRMTVGTYTGNGLSGLAITGVGFSPKFMLIMSATTNSLISHSSQGTLSYEFDEHAGSSMVNSLDADGFTLGTDARVNRAGAAFHYVAWNTVPGEVAQGYYEGNGYDNRNITGVGFRPELVIIKSGSAYAAVHHAAALGSSTDVSQFFLAYNNQANEIQALQSNGFQVGTDYDVNRAYYDYGWFAWKKTILPSRLAIITVNGGSNPIAGTPFHIVVQAQDAAGNPASVKLNTPLVISLNTGGGTLGGTLTGILPAGSSSVTISNLTYTKAESGVILTATRTRGDNLAAGNSSAFTVGPGAFAQLQLLVPGELAAPGSASGKTGAPSPRTAGSPFDVIVNAVDTNWNVVNSTHVISLTANDTNAALPENAALVGGTMTFGVTYKTAGLSTLTATDITDGTKTPDTSPATTVNAGAFEQVQILMPGEFAAPGSATGKSGAPCPQTAGLAVSNITVNAVDANWNRVDTVTDLVQIYDSSDPNAELPPAAALVDGTQSYSVTFKTAGNRTVTAKDVTAVKTENTSSATAVAAGPFSKLQVLMPGETAVPGTATGKTGAPDAQTVATPFAVVVNAVDACWNAVDSADTVAITASDTNAMLPPSAALVAGTGSFDVTFQTAGNQSVTATDVGQPAITDTGSTATVNRADQIMTFPTPGDQTYGVGPLELAATASSGLPVSYTVTSGPASVSSNSLTITGAGSVTVEAAQPGNDNWNAALPVSRTFSVAARVIAGAITANDKVYDGTANATIASRTLEGVTNSDIVILSGGTALFTDKNASAGKTVIATGLILEGTHAGNYVLASDAATNTAAITPAALLVSATGVDRMYDGTTNATVTLSDDRISGDALTTAWAGAAFGDKNVGTGKTVAVWGISIGGADSGNYAANSTAVASASITAAPLTVSANSTNRLYGVPNPEFTYNCSGFVAGEDTQVLEGSPALATEATTNSPVGSYPIEISPGTLSTANYTFSLTNGTLVVMEIRPVLMLEYVPGLEGAPDQAVLRAEGLTPGNVYHIQAAPDPYQWLEIGAPEAAVDGTITLIDTNVVEHPFRLYRLAN